MLRDNDPSAHAEVNVGHIDKIYYAASWSDYADLFDDSNISHDMKQSFAKRTVRVAQPMREDAQKVWLEYRNLPSKARY